MNVKWTPEWAYINHIHSIWNILPDIKVVSWTNFLKWSIALPENERWKHELFCVRRALPEWGDISD